MATANLEAGRRRARRWLVTGAWRSKGDVDEVTQGRRGRRGRQGAWPWRDAAARGGRRAPAMEDALRHNRVGAGGQLGCATWRRTRGVEVRPAGGGGEGRRCWWEKEAGAWGSRMLGSTSPWRCVWERGNGARGVCGGGGRTRERVVEGREIGFGWIGLCWA